MKVIDAIVISSVNGKVTTFFGIVVGPDGNLYLDSQEVDLSIAVTRIYGANRYATSMKIASKLKDVLGLSEFNTVILATGKSYPDALSGAYLGVVNDAPVLTIGENKKSVCNYVKSNLPEGSTIYILGDEKAIPESWLFDLPDSYEIVRLGGVNRYATNMEILKKSGVTGGDIMVCTGENYPDALIASATGNPVFLVGKSLKNSQKKYLATLSNVRFHIVGSEDAVSEAVVNDLANYGTIVRRTSGSGICDSSIKFAQTYFNDPKQVILAYDKDFPDGMSAGVLAVQLHAPLILTDSSEQREAVKEYVASTSIKTGYVLGANQNDRINDESVRIIFHMTDMDLIEEY